MPDMSPWEMERIAAVKKTWWYNAPLYIAYPHSKAEWLAQEQYLAMSELEREMFKADLRAARTPESPKATEE